MSKSLGKNIAYSMLSQMVSLMVPLIVAPYTARVLNAELLGSYSYALANSSYFVLIECMGLPLYGQLKISAIRDDMEERSTVFWEITCLKLLFMSVCLVLYLPIIVLSPNTMARHLSLVMVLNIVANGIDTTWFLNGLEEFKLTATRNIFVRGINLILILLLVKQENDIYIYAWIVQGATLLAFIAILPQTLKRVKKVCFSCMNIKRHIKPAGIYFIPGLVTTIFSSADKTMIGIMSNSYEVGVYEQASKVSHICIDTISAIGNVLMPRAAYLYHNGKDKKEADRMFYNSLAVVLMISLPMTFGASVIAGEFIPIFFGPGYEKSIRLLIALSATILFTPLNSLCGQQCLIARNKQKSYNIAITVSALANVILNSVLIPYLQSIGAALASVVACVVIMLMINKMSEGLVSIKKMLHLCWKYILASIGMFMAVKLSLVFMHGTLTGLILHILAGLCFYCVFLFLLRDKTLFKMLKVKRK